MKALKLFVRETWPIFIISGLLFAWVHRCDSDCEAQHCDRGEPLYMAGECVCLERAH